MFDYVGIFNKSSGLYREDNLVDTARLNLMLGTGGLPELNEGDEDDSYGFLRESYRHEAENRATLYPDHAEDAIKVSALDKATNLFYEETYYGTRDSSSVYKSLFKSFENKIFDDENLDRQFNTGLVQDMLDHVQGKTITNSRLVPQFNFLGEISRSLAERDVFNSVRASADLREDLENFTNQAFKVGSILPGSTPVGMQKGKNLLDNIDYIHRPGILPAVAMISDAQNEFFIDIFQLQNSTITDYHVSELVNRAKIYREEVARGNTPTKFKYTARLALPTERAYDMTTYTILGSNIAFGQKLMVLKDVFGDALDINLQYVGNKNHSKVMLNESTAVVGSLNLTAPVGQSAFQAGSNYEAIRVLHYRNTMYSPDELINKINSGQVSRKSIDADTLQYLQVRQNMLDTVQGRSSNYTGMANVAGPGEVGDYLNTTLDYLHSKKGTARGARMDLVLDQVFLLQYQENLFWGESGKGGKLTGGAVAGEMGSFEQGYLNSREAFIRKKAANYQATQRKLLELIIDNRASAVVDVRNYAEKVQKPIFEKLRGSGIWADYGNDLSNIVSRLSSGKTAQERISSLTSGISSYGLDESMAIQMLVMTSGNVTTSSVAKQHDKSVLAYEFSKKGDRDILFFKDGSSNMGMHSLGFDNSAMDIEMTNQERDILYVSKELRNQHVRNKGAGTVGFGLSSNQEQEQLRLANQKFLSKQNDLMTGRVSRDHQIQYTNTYTKGEWQSNVDRRATEELYSRLQSLQDLTKNSFEVALEYDNRGATNVIVKINPNELGGGGAGQYGLRYRLTALSTGIPEDVADGNFRGQILDIDSNNIITGSEIYNKTGVALRTGFKRGGRDLVVDSGRRERINSIETTLSMIASVTNETASNLLISKPKSEFLNRYEDNSEAMSRGMEKYLLKLLDIRSGNIHDLWTMSGDDINLSIVKNFEARYKNNTNTSDPLAKVRAMTGIHSDDQMRAEGLDRVMRALYSLSQTGAEGRKNIIMGGKSLEVEHSLLSTFNELMKHDNFADLRYDFITSQRNTVYEREVGKGNRALKSKYYKSNLLNNSAYSSTQAYRRTNIYGYDEKRENEVNLINEMAGTEGITGLAAYSMLNSPMSFNPTDELGKGSLYYLAVAESGGSRETEVSRGVGDEMTGDEDGTNFLRAHDHTQVGHFTSLEIIEDTRVGAITTRKDAAEYEMMVAHLGKTGIEAARKYKNRIDQLISDDEHYIQFFFDRVGKSSQIPQRLKNVVGTKPLLDVSEEYQELIESNREIEYNMRYSTGTRKVGTASDLSHTYLEDMRQGIRRLGGNESIVSEELGIGALYSNRISNNLGAEMSDHLEAIREAFINRAGIRREDTYTGVGAELFRATLVHLHTHGASLRGFLGDSRRGNRSSIGLLQLGGAYSDYAYANPYYGGDEGIRRSYVDKTTKKQQGSKLRATVSRSDLNDAFEISSWEILKELNVSSDSIIRFDAETMRSWVYKYDAKTKEYTKHSAVDERNQYVVLKNVIEKLSKKPSFSYLEAKSSAASFYNEDAVEVIRNLRILEGNVHSNEVGVEINYDRTMKEGGGRRLDSTMGGLLKVVPQYIGGNFMQRVLDDFNSHAGGSFTGNKIQLDQLIGIFNPSNFKSYFFSHGAEILVRDNGKGLNNMIDNTRGESLVAALLFGFGSDKFAPHGKLEDMYKILAQRANEGTLGKYYQDLYKYQKMVNAGANDMQIVGSLLKGIGDKAGEGLGDSVKKGIDGDFSDLNVRILSTIDHDTMTRVLQGDKAATRQLKTQLKDILSDPTGRVVTPDYLKLDKSGRGRELSIIAGGLDIFTQIQTAEAIRMDMGNVHDDQTRKILSSVAGLTKDDIDNRKDEFLSVLDSITNYSYAVAVYMNASGSSTKVPISTRNKVSLEAQHIISESYSNQMKGFSKGGSIDQLRSMYASLMGAMYGATTDQMLHASKSINKYDLMSPYVRSGLFKEKTIGYYNNSQVSEEVFEAYRSRYSLYSKLALITNSKKFSGGKEDTKLINDLIRSSASGKEGRSREIIKAINKGDHTAANSLVNAGFQEILGDLENMYTSSKLMADKPSATGTNKQMIQGLERTGAKTLLFEFPTLTIEGDRVLFNKEETSTGILLGATEAGIVGQITQDFESAEVKAIKTVYEGMVEGSPLSILFDKIAAHHDSVGEIEVGIDLAKMAGEWQDTVVSLPLMLSVAMQGARTEKLFGNRIDMAGTTTTASASLFVPHGVLATGDALGEKFGSAAADKRKRVMVDSEGNMGVSASRMEYYEKQIKQIEGKYSLKPEGEVYDKSELSVLTRDQRRALSQRAKFRQSVKSIQRNRELIHYQYIAGQDGLSDNGMNSLRILTDESTSLRSRVDSTTSTKEVEKIIGEIDIRIGAYARNEKSQRANRGKGDYFSAIAATNEMQALRGYAAKKMRAIDRNATYRGSRLDRIIQTGNELNNAPVLIEGLLLGSKYKSKADKLGIEDYRGELRRGSSNIIDKFDREGNLATREGLTNNIKVVRDIVTEHRDKMVSDYNGFFDKSEHLKEINNTLDALDNYDKWISKASHYQMQDIRLILDSQTARVMTELGLSRLHAWRSAPLGNEFLNYAKYTKGTLGDLDNRLGELGIDIRFDNKRNKTLSLMNPISFYQSQGGDFDGDTLSIVLEQNHMMKVHHGQNKLIIEELQVKESHLTTKIMMETDPNKKLEYQEELAEVTNRMSRLQSANDSMSITIKRTEDHNEVKKFEDAARKWTANYLKVDKSILDNVDVNTMFSFIENGRGLFGGMEDRLHTVKPLIKLALDTTKHIGELVDDTKFSGLLNRIKSGADEKVGKIIDTLQADPTMRDQFRGDLHTASLHSEGVEVGVGKFIGGLINANTANESLQKYQSRGLVGTGMHEDTWKMMLTTMGNAGSVLLGKTYNSFAGLLYTESPFLAMSHALESDHDGKLEDILKNHLGDAEYQKMKVNAAKARDNSEKMGGWQQVTQQIMREAVKPKNSEEFLKEINEVLTEYRNAPDEKTRRGLTDKIVSKFGPGPGLRAFMQNDMLIRNMHELSIDPVKNGDMNLKSSQDDIMKAFNLSDESEREFLGRLGYLNTSGSEQAHSDIYGTDRTYSKRQRVAAYKTKLDLVAAVASYEYDKGLGTTGDEEAKSSGRYLISLFEDRMNNDATFKARHSGMIDAAMGNRHVDSLSEEEYGFVHSIRSMMSTEEYKGMSEGQKAYAAHIYMNSNDQVRYFAGERGEGMLKLAEFNNKRQDVYSDNEGGASGTPHFDVEKDPTLMAHVMAASHGKVRPETTSMFFNSLVDNLRLRGISATHEDALLAGVSMGSLNSSPESTAFMGALQKALLIDRDSRAAAGLEVGGEGSLSKLLQERVNSTQFGQTVSTMDAIMKGSTHEDSEITEDQLVEYIKRSSGKKGRQVDDASALHFARTYLGSNSNKPLAEKGDPLEEFLYNNMARSNKPTSTVNRAMGKSGELGWVGKLPRHSDVGIELVAMPLLALLGQAISGGSVKADSVQQITGSAISTGLMTHYSRLNPSMESEGLQGAARLMGGMAFLSRNAIRDADGDVGKGLLSLAAQQIAAVGIHQMIAEPIANAVKRGMGHQEHSLDFDKYGAGRMALGNIIGNVITSFLTNMIVGEVKHAITPSNDSPIGSTIDAALSYLQGLSRNDPQDVFGTIEDDFEDDLVQYSTMTSFSTDPNGNPQVSDALYGGMELDSDDEVSSNYGDNNMSDYSMSVS